MILSCLLSLLVMSRRRQCTVLFGGVAGGQGFHSEKPEQASSSFVKFNKDKCSVRYLEWTNHLQQYRLETYW